MNALFRGVLIFVTALIAVGFWSGCSYDKLYKNYNTYHDDDDPKVTKSTTTTTTRTKSSRY
jgi:hypothetical protein